MLNDARIRNAKPGAAPVKPDFDTFRAHFRPVRA
jgi:hypothetical protein